MGFLEDRDTSDLPSIPDFYSGKSLFITGGSGFMGQVLIEKLLYSCGDLNKIYILLREKKGIPGEDRLKKLYESSCFNRLRLEKPNIFAEKVVAVPGDICSENLEHVYLIKVFMIHKQEPCCNAVCIPMIQYLFRCISEQDRQTIRDNVQIIFHVAASIRFNDTLPFAVNTNILSAKRVIELAYEVKNLLVLVHVSTSYANCDRFYVEEKMYPPFADWRDTVEICEKLDKNVLEAFTDKYTHPLPNTYVFTKQLAEHLVYEHRGKLPIVISRPSIVIAAHTEPVPGWINNFNGPTAIVLPCGKGIMRSIYGRDVACDYVTVDICIRHFIALAWIRGTKKFEPTDDIPIYQSCSGKLHDITMNRMVTDGQALSEKFPLDGIIWFPNYSVTSSRTYHYIKVVLFQVLQAVLVDSLLYVVGRKTLLMKIQRRIYQATVALEYFVENQFTFQNDNFVKLLTVIKEEDKNDFNYIVEGLDTYSYFEMCAKNCPQYLLNQPPIDFDKSRKQYFRLKVIYYITWTLVYGYLFWIAINTSYFKNATRCVQNLF